MLWRVAALVGSLIFVGTAPAGATTYCVAPATGCGGGDHPTLAGALTAASNSAGADDVRLGAATYVDGPWSYVDNSATNPVTIRGAGFLQSQLNSSAAGPPTLTLVNGNADNVIVGTPTAGANPVALQLVAGTLSNSQVLVAANGLGINAEAAVIDHSSITPAGPAATGNTAVHADTTTVKDTSMSTTDGVLTNDGQVAVRRATIVTQGVGLESPFAATAISDSLIVLNDATAVGVQGVCDLATGTIAIEATNLTVTGGGSGIAFRSTGSQNCGGHVAVSSSLVQGVGTTVDCVAGALPGATAAVVVSYSDADLSAGEVTGTCSQPVNAAGNFLADPKLATPATLNPVPRFDSPLIDAGDPVAPGAEQPTDIAGLPRAVNGRRDVGAFEYGRRAPALSAGSSPAAALTGEPFTFSATTSDLDLGDVVTVGWSFDDGATATGDQVTHAFAAAGMHTATATATDSAGVTTVSPVIVTVNELPDTKAPETEITRQPKARTKKRKAVFEFSSNEPGGSFECKLDKAAPAACTSPFKHKVKAGRRAHNFSVVAIDAAGNRDATPATYSWKVKRKTRTGGRG